MARKNPDTTSVRNKAWAARSSLMASSLYRAGGKAAVLDDAGDDGDHGQRQRQEDLPAEPHQLVVAITRHDRLGHGEQEEHEQRLEREPDDARHPGKRRERDRRQPA